MLRIIAIAICIWTLGCASTSKEQSSPEISFDQASKKFDSTFPKTWPAKKVTLPLSKPHKMVLQQMVMATSAKLAADHVAFKKLSPYQLKITPAPGHLLNTYALELSQDNIELKYDAFYFAKNPFSAGTFDDTKSQLLISHGALKSEASARGLLAHENVHVETFRDRRDQKSSPFFCRFRGKAFAPHYLACDEMKAYNKDINRLVQQGKDQKTLLKKIKVAKRHTQHIPLLIGQLNWRTLRTEGPLTLIEGQNNGESFTVEFPTFATGASSPTVMAAKAYLTKVASSAEAYMEFLNKL